jgi:hypothetical protein
MTYPKLTPIEFVDKLQKETENHISTLSASFLYHDHSLGQFVKRFGGPSTATATKAVIDQLMTIFYRLTQKPVGSLVPLKDLLDIIETPYPNDKPRANARLYEFFKNYLIEMSRRMEFPFSYYPSAAAFGREDNLPRKIIAIKNVEAVLEGKCPHCVGNLTKEQVDNFSTNKTITCKYCNHSIRAEWVSK